KFTDTQGKIILRSSDAPGNRIRVEIVDNGMGIDASVLPKLFYPFEQGEIRTLRQHAGLGLGLAIAKKLVDAHDGTIAAVSEGRGKGATFIVELPISMSTAATETITTLDTPAATTRSLRILVVEDHPPTLEVLSKLLQLMG